MLVLRDADKKRHIISAFIKIVSSALFSLHILHIFHFVFNVFTLEQGGIKFSETVVETDSHYLRIPAAAVILNKEIRR